MIAVLVGVGLLVGMVAWIGPATLVQQFTALGWAPPLLVVLGLPKHILRTLAWKEALKAEGVVLEFRELLRVRIGSESLAYLSSMGALVAEPLKPWLLRKTVAFETTIPATIVEAGVYWFVSLFVTTVGAFVAINLVANRQHALMLSLICLIASGAVVLLLFMRTPLLPRLVQLVNRRRSLRPRWASGLRKAGEMETQMRSFRLRHPRTIGGILCFHLLVQVIMFAEVWMVLSAVGVSTGFLQLAAIEAASRMVKIMSFYLPARLGADEAGAAGSFLLLGLDPAAGLTLAVVRRVQALCWTAVGLAWLSRGRALRKPLPASPNESYQPVTDGQ